jgi:RNA polymerase sigma factor (sigma-70 family)
MAHYTESVATAPAADIKGSENDPTPPGRAAFPDTRWTRVRRCAAGDDSKAAQQALDQLCRDYWFPLYAFARRSGHGREDAQDQVQGFFEKAIDEGLFGKADPNAGRLRAFLLVSFKHFQCTLHKRRNTFKRGGAGWSRVNWAEAEELLESATGSATTPEEEFDRQWALRMLNRAVNILAEQYELADRSALFEELRGFLNPEAVVEAPVARMAEKFGMTKDAVRQAVTRIRQRFRATLRQLIADTLESPEQEDVDFEMETLRRALLQN